MLQAAPASSWNPPCWEGGGLAHSAQAGQGAKHAGPGLPPRPCWAPKYPSSLGKARPHSISMESKGRGGRGLVHTGWSCRTLHLTGKYRKGGAAEGMCGGCWEETDLPASSLLPSDSPCNTEPFWDGWGMKWSRRSRKCTAQRLFCLSWAV